MVSQYTQVALSKGMQSLAQLYVDGVRMIQPLPIRRLRGLKRKLLLTFLAPMSIIKIIPCYDIHIGNDDIIAFTALVGNGQRRVTDNGSSSKLAIQFHACLIQLFVLNRVNRDIQVVQGCHTLMAEPCIQFKDVLLLEQSLVDASRLSSPKRNRASLIT